MKQLVLILFLASAASAQIYIFPPAGGVGVGAPNPYTYTVGASTSSAVDITSLNAANDRSLIAQCWTASGPVAITGWSASGGPPLTTLTLNYTSTSGVTCRANSNGGAGAKGDKGDTGATGATGAKGDKGDTGATGATGAKGDKGDTGSTGATGAKGDKGDPGPVGSSLGVDFTNQASATITHNWNTLYYSTECVDSSGEVLRPASTSKTNNAMTWNFSPNASGSCSITSGGSGSGGSYTLPTASNSVLGGVKVGTGLSIDGAGVLSATGNGSMVYPPAGVPQSTGAGWGSSLTVGVLANNLIQLNGLAQLPAVSAALLTNFPTLNQNTTGNAATASALETPRTIFGVSFNGTSNIGSRSGNTTEVATVSGAKTTGKQLQYDANGNITASSTDIGAGSGGASALVPIAFAGEPNRTVTAASHGLGTTFSPFFCRRTSDGVWTQAAVTSNSSGDVTIEPAAGAAYTGTCYIGGSPSGALVLVDPALVPTRITGTASLSYSTFSGTGNCEEQNVTVAGAAPGDVPTTSLYSTLPAGIVLGAVYVSTSNTVTIRLCRLAGTNTISSQTFNAQIVRGM